MSVHTETSQARVRMEAEASGRSAITQVAGDYAEHHHSYFSSWAYLEAPVIDEEESRIINLSYVHGAKSSNQEQEVDHAVRLLQSPYGPSNVLVLTGPVGSGRRTTALRVLLSAGVKDEKLHSLILDWDSPRARQVPHTPGHGFILDLSEFGTLSQNFYQGLIEYRLKAMENGSYLII